MAYCDGSDFEGVIGPSTAAIPWWAILIIVLVMLSVLGMSICIQKFTK